MSAVDDRRQMAAQVDAIFDCLLPAAGGTCVLPAGHQDQCTAMPAVVPLCRLCRGRTRVPGTDDTCPTCGGSGLAEVTA